MEEQPLNDNPPSETDLAVLVTKLSVEQKVRLLTGASLWRTYDEPAVGLRAMVASDGPVGVRGEHWDERDTSLALPSPTALAATFDEELVARLGGLLAREARRKDVDILLAPMLNLHRSPLAGRHFESFSEDPLLTGRIGAAYIKGVQAGGVAATAKHYVANESETDRLTLSVRVDEATLHEVYLAPFEAAVDAGVWAVMSGYHGIDGITMSAHPLLAEPLKGRWEFDGVVVSDWGALRTAVPTARAAQDLAMPGPESPWADELLDAVRRGEVAETVIDDKVVRLLRLAGRVGALSGPTAVARRSATPDPRDRALLRRAVAAGTVLLRNERDLLPLALPAARGPRPRTIAVLGPGAAAARIQGGGSAGMYPASVVSPLEGILRATAGRATVRHTAGVHVTDRPSPLHAGNARDPRTGEPGVLLRVLDTEGREIHAEHRLSGRILEPAGQPADAGSVELHAVLCPDVTGPWRIEVTGLGHVSLTADDVVVFDEVVPVESTDPAVVHVAPPYRHLTLDLTEGEEVALVVRRRLAQDTGWVVGLAAEAPRRSTEDELAAAVDLARTADVAVVVVGTTEEFESEGFDRTTLALPGAQDALVAAVVAANPSTVVVVNSGGPVAMPWRERVPSVLLSWFPGQEAGDGIADVLFGTAEPGGRLPTTWAARTQDAPVLSTVPVDGVLHYAEGPNIGYRAWAGSDVAPAYWFGHGLGYTTWSYDNVIAPARVAQGQRFAVYVRVTNTGRRAGREVVQVYLSRPGSDVDRPLRWLVGYAAVRASAGETVEAAVLVRPRAVEHWSTDEHDWRTEAGEFRVHAGRSAGDLPLSTTTSVG
jgi:beta-glucosidase